MEDEYKVEKTKFGIKTTHPSYGTLMFNRAYGGKTPLFGSSIELVMLLQWNLDMLISQED